MMYETVRVLSKRARFKEYIKDARSEYCHFVLQNYRIEAIRDDNGYIVCVCKGGMKKHTNNRKLYNRNTVYIKDSCDEYISDMSEYSKFKNIITAYIKKHYKWFQKDILKELFKEEF